MNVHRHWLHTPPREASQCYRGDRNANCVGEREHSKSVLCCVLREFVGDFPYASDIQTSDFEFGAKQPLD